jgi:hypothetical protein
MAENPSLNEPPGKTQPLRPIRPLPNGVGISVEFMNDIINRVEDLVLIAQSQKPVAGNYIDIQYLGNGSVINVVTA